jgi:hypothetical protein
MTVGKAMLDLAGKASPVQMERFQMALDDAQAVAGRMFVPVLELATDGMRLFGDVLASILPSADEMRTVLAPIKDAFNDLRDGLAPMAPVLRELIKFSIQGAAAILKLSITLNPFIKILGALGRLSGAAPLETSVGAAQKPAQFMSVDAYIRQSYAAAASMGSPGEKEKKGPLDTMIDAAIAWFKNPWVTIPGGERGAAAVRAAVPGGGYGGFAGDIGATLIPGLGPLKKLADIIGASLGYGAGGAS